MLLPDHIQRLQQTLETFKRSYVDGVPGVMKIGGRVPGPVLGITACTHGNEPAGLAIFDALLGELALHKNLLRGTVYLVVNNIEAADAYFAATTENEQLEARACDVNMNRLPVDVLQYPKSPLYEGRRACELVPIWKRFTIGLDVHSTTRPSEPMIISRGDRLPAHLVRGFPIRKLISNIDQVQWGIPAFALYGNPHGNTAVFAIEAGQHEDAQALVNAKACAVVTLQHLEMLPGTPGGGPVEYEEYIVRDKFWFDDKFWSFVRTFNMFDEVKYGEVIAINDSGREIRAPLNGHILFPTTKVRERAVSTEEAGFFTERVKLRTFNA